MRLEKNHDFTAYIFLSSVILPCKHVFCFQVMTEEKKCGKGEKKKSGKREKKKTQKKTQSYVKPTPVLDFTDEQQDDVKEEKKKKKNVAKR